MQRSLLVGGSGRRVSSFIATICLFALGSGAAGCGDAPRSREEAVDSTAAPLFISSCDTNLLEQIVPAKAPASSVALSADDVLIIKKRATVKRDASSGFAPVLSAGSLLITDIKGQTGDVISKPAVLLSSPAQINGSVTSGSSVTVLPGASVTGTIKTQASIALGTVQRTITFPGNAGSSVLVPIGGTRTITPGAYSSILVPAGATLNLEPGEYYVRSMTVDLLAKVVMRDAVSPVYLYVRDVFLPNGTFTEQATGDLAGNFEVGVFHCQALLLLKPWVGTLIAPTSSVLLTRTTTPHRGAVFARSITLDEDANLVHVPFPSELIQKVDVSKLNPCQNEEVSVVVTTRSQPGATTPVEVAIGESQGAERNVQFMGTGPHFVTVSASQGSVVDVRTITLDVQHCSAVFPRIIQQASLNQPYAVELTVANADQLTGTNRVFHWDFGDGSTQDTPYPFVVHSYEAALDKTSALLNFDVTLRITRNAVADVTATEIVTMRNQYAAQRKQGYVRPPQTSDSRLIRDGKVLHGHYKIRNLESTPITYTSKRLQKHFCDPDLDPQLLPAETVSMVVPASGALEGDLVVPVADYGSNVCGVSLLLSGSASASLAVRTSIHFETPQGGFFTQPVTDPAVLQLLHDVAAGSLSSSPDRISEDELRVLHNQGRIGFVPSLEGFDTGALQSGGPQIGDRCDPEQDDSGNPGLTCIPTEEWEVSPPFIRNALKGDVFIVSACETIGELLRVMVPRQQYSHEGIFTRNYYTLSHSTANEERILESVNCELPIFPDCSNIDESRLRFAWPGAIINTSVYAAFHGEPAGDPEGVVRQLSGFVTEATRCVGDGQPNPPILIRPVPAEEANVRPLLQQAANFAGSFDAASHYRWFGYSQGNIAFDPPNNFASPPRSFADPDGDRATVSTSFIWHSLKTVSGLTLEGTDADPSDMDVVDLPTGAGIIDGLYFYSEKNRKRGAQQIYDSTRNRVKDTQEAKTLGIPGLDWWVEGWSDQADDIASQFTNCFGSDDCGDHGAQSDAWKNPGTGVAVSPDNFLSWDPPHMVGGTRVGVFGDTEFLLYRNADYRRIYRLAAATGAGTLTGRVVLASSPTTGVANAIVTLDAASAGTDANGNFTLAPVPAGHLEIRAEKDVLASDPTQDCPPPGGPSPVPCVNLVKVQPIDIAPGANGPIEIQLEPEHAIPPPTIEVFASRVEFEAHVHLVDDDESSTTEGDFDVDGFCEVSPFDREQTGVAIPAGRNPVMCADEVRTEITVGCRLLGDNKQVEVTLRVNFFEGSSCSTDDLDGHYDEVLVVNPCDSEEPLTCPFSNRNIVVLNDDGFEFADDSFTTVDLTMFNHHGTKIEDLPNVQAENLRQVNFGGNVHIHDDETWPASDENSDFTFAGDCIVDPTLREDDFEWTRCAGAEVRIDVKVTCRLGLDNQSVDVETEATMHEGTTCDNDDKDGVEKRDVLISPCGGSCSPTPISFSVKNKDEGGDKATLDLTATNVQR